MKRDVNVICMSWSMYESDSGENAESLDKLAKTLHTAAMQGILLYCAGQDKGMFEETLGRGKALPASSGHTRIKSIGSARIYGGQSEYVNIDNVDYLFPGEIETVQGLTSGSSAATALASGLAALILWCGEAHRARQVLEQKKAASKAKDGKEGKHAEDANRAVEEVDFQKEDRMTELFNELKTDSDKKKASLVNITALLNDAARNKDDCAGELIRLCKGMVPKSFARPVNPGP
jgi:hypothetical protein